MRIYVQLLNKLYVYHSLNTLVIVCLRIDKIIRILL